MALVKNKKVEKQQRATTTLTWKKLDERIRTLIQNGIKSRHRSMFVMVGDLDDTLIDGIVSIHGMLRNEVVKSKPSVLWCYKEALELSSHKEKLARQTKKLIESGSMDSDTIKNYSVFAATTRITHCLYKDTDRILGNTFGMCILQDFEDLTPNVLARTIETVEGGGLIILLIRTLPSLTSLVTMAMNVQERSRTASHAEACGRFNERFLLSLASCKSCMVLDHKIDLLPISSHMKTISTIPSLEDSEGLSEAERELKNLKEQLNDDFPAGHLIRECRTMDQGKAVITFLDVILDKSPKSITTLLAPRGRGKSAALGLAIAGAVAAGYSNIYVTAPRPENLKTLFEFVCRGLNMLGYKEDHYDVVPSRKADYKRPTVRININKQHRQTIQYIQPHEHGKLSQADLLVIDEAAAIPLALVESLLGPYVVFLSSTVNGYEGTGMSLSLKLLQKLKKQKRTSDQPFKKIELSESIRYGSADPIESWLDSLLCLNATNTVPSISRLPPPCECELYHVNRDTLFSYHKDSELFLQRVMALYVASDYQSSPDDLKVMADAPNHHLFVLLGPVNQSENRLPDILCVIQICFEGQICRESSMKSLSAGRQLSGDSISWTFSRQYPNTDFPSLSGARIVRIATHPSAMRLGYGSAAIKLLTRYFEGELSPISEIDIEETPAMGQATAVEAAEKASHLEETLKPRTNLPPLLAPISERPREKLHYLGASFGLTQVLCRFWRKHGFDPFHVGFNPDNMTGEHTCMVLRPLKNDDIENPGILSSFYQEFRKEFATHLGRSFTDLECNIALSLFPKMDPATWFSSSKSPDSVCEMLSSNSMKKLVAYATSTENHNSYENTEAFAGDLARAYFRGEVPVTLSPVQASVLLCLGLQCKKIPAIEKELNLDETRGVLTYYMQVMKELYKYMKRDTSNKSPVTDITMEAHPVSVDDDLDDAAEEVEAKMQANEDDATVPDLLQQYAIKGDLENALPAGRVKPGGLISIKSNRSTIQKRKKQAQGSKTNKRRKS